MTRDIKQFFKFLWPFSKKNKNYFFALTIFVFLGVALEIPYPLFLKYFIDVIIKNKDIQKLQLFTLVLIGILLFKFVVDNLKNYFSYIFKEKTFIQLQSYIFNEVIKVKYDFFEKNNTGYIISRIHNEVLSLQQFFWDFFIRLTTDIFMFAIGLFFIFQFSVKLACISLLLLPFFIFSFSFFSKKIEKHSHNFQESYSIVYGFFYEIIQMVFLVKTLLLRGFVERKLKKILESFFVVKKKNTIVNTLFSTIIMFIGGLSPLIILYIGGLEIINGNLTLGTLIAFNSFLEYIYGPTKNLITYGSDISSALASFKRIQSILNLEKDVETGEKIDQIDSVSFKNVSFGYDSNVILHNISFKIKKGEVIGVFGKIGSGKSTLIKLLMGLYSDYRGEIQVNNKNIINYKNINKRMGIIPQDNFLFSDTIFNNIKIGNLEGDDEIISDIIESLKLNDFIKSRAGGIKYKLFANGIGLSGGEKQKIVAARMIYRNPDLLIIDEGTSNLDADSEYQIYKNILKNFKDKIVIIISHRFSNIVSCDRIIYLDNGKIKDVGKHKKLFANHEEYRELFFKQNNREGKLKQEVL